MNNYGWLLFVDARFTDQTFQYPDKYSAQWFFSDEDAYLLNEEVRKLINMGIDNHRISVYSVK